MKILKRERGQLAGSSPRRMDLTLQRGTRWVKRRDDGNRIVFTAEEKQDNSYQCSFGVAPKSVGG